MTATVRFGLIGCGMIARGEVALAVYATGQSLICRNGDTVTGIDPLVATISLIVISSILCPVLLNTHQLSADVCEVACDTVNDRKTGTG